MYLQKINFEKVLDALTAFKKSNCSEYLLTSQAFN